jgi:hypothetical protein
MVPALDFVARRWLLRSQSPYVGEVKAIAAALGFPGIWFLNGSYQWSCTTCARDEGGAPWLARTLDWPFPGLGRHVEIARMRGPAGEFYNVTWPGYVGALTAMAPGRFGASINQAPMRRRGHSIQLRLVDLAANGLHTLLRVRSIPPDQLLRKVFEECRDFGEAKAMLERTPIARPVIYTLVGCAPGERCVIERTEDAADTRDHDTGSANNWLVTRPKWEARIGADKVFTSSFEDAAENSRARRAALFDWPGQFSGGGFDWIAAPVLNRFTRLGVEMCPAQGVLRAAGYEMTEGAELPVQVTAIRELQADRLAA